MSIIENWVVVLVARRGYRKSEDAYRTTYEREIALLSKGNTLKDVRSITGTSINTLRKLKENYC